MTDQKKMYFIVFRGLSYASLAVVLAGVGSVFLLVLYQSCAQLDFQGVACKDPTNQMLGQFGMAIFWATLYTIVPAILALSGAYFGVMALMKKERERLSSKKP